MSYLDDTEYDEDDFRDEDALSNEEIREIALEIAQGLLNDADYQRVVQQDGAEDATQEERDRIYDLVTNAVAVLTEDD